MKNNFRLLVVALGIISVTPAIAQKDNVGIGTSKPDQSAVLDISSSNKGLLMPRMSLQQRNSIQSPAKGLIVYQTDMLSGFYFYDGAEWKPLVSETSANSIAADPNDWTMNGNVANATSASYIGVGSSIPLNFRIGGFRAGLIESNALGRNTAFGYQALNTNSISQFNAAFGAFALKSLTSGGGRNFALGASALELLTSGERNIAIGVGALSSETTGSRNTAIGDGAGGFTLGSDNLFLGYRAGNNETGSNKLYIANSNTANPLIKGEFDNKNLKINTGATVSSTLGFLAVGNFDAAYTMPASNSYRLIVQDGIITEKVKVALKSTADWADYVFEPSYKLMSLEKVEEFVKENKHLPNVPSAEDMSKNGLDVSQTSAKLMEKIEELTLYMIEMNKEIKALKAENEKLKNK